jgi:hypothetical protein
VYKEWNYHPTLKRRKLWQYGQTWRDALWKNTNTNTGWPHSHVQSKKDKHGTECGLSQSLHMWQTGNVCWSIQTYKMKMSWTANANIVTTADNNLYLAHISSVFSLDRYIEETIMKWPVISFIVVMILQLCKMLYMMNIYTSFVSNIFI